MTAPKTRGRTLTVTTQIEALVLKRAVTDFIKGIETGTDTTDTLVSNEEIITAAEDILTNVEGLVFFHKVEPVTRKRKTKAKVEETEVTA